jgi:hypothetical protein
LTVVGIHRIRDQTIDRRAPATIQSVGQDRVDDCSLEKWMERTGRTDGLCTFRSTLLATPAVAGPPGAAV